jgi:protein-disulfide isomerase-like protein with CxxC motif
MQTHEYLIIRHGSNVANQGCQRAAVAIVEATSREEAREQAARGAVIASDTYTAGEPTLTVYANQHLEAIPRSQASPSEWTAVLEADARHRR